MSGPEAHPLFIDNPDHWRKRAAEMRALGEQVSDAKAREIMIALAENYGRLAQRAEERISGRTRATWDPPAPIPLDRLNASNDE